MPNNHIYSTFGDDNFYANSVSFDKNLVNQAIIYFDSAEYLNPIQDSSVDQLAESTEIFAEKSDSQNVTKVREGSVVAKGILVVPTYGNKKKALQTLMSKLVLTGKGGGFAVSINKLRAEALTEQAKKVDEITQVNKSKSEKEIKNSKNKKNPNNSESQLNSELDSEESKSIWDDKTSEPDIFEIKDDTNSQENSW